MRFYFEKGKNKLIYLKGIVSYNEKTHRILMILDTGATSTVINTDYIISLGYDIKNDSYDSENLITGSGLTKAVKLNLEIFKALGQIKNNFPVLVYNLPPQTLIGGILGNDFLEEYCITINFPEKWLEIK